MRKYSSEYDARTERRRKITRSRRKKAVVAIVAAMAVLVAAVPTAALLFDKVLASDANVDVLSSLIARVVPDSLVQKITGSAASDTSSDTSATLQADELEGADITDPNVLAETTPVSDAYLETALIFADAAYNVFQEEELISSDNLFTISNFTPSALAVASFSDSVSGASGSTADIVQKRSPAEVYIFPGLTGTDEENNNTYMTALGNLIDSIQTAAPEVPIVVASIAPVGSDYAGEITNDRIRTLNGNILSLLREKNAYYLNTFTALTNERGVLASEYDNGSGLLNTDAYKEIMDVLKNHAVPTS